MRSKKSGEMKGCSDTVSRQHQGLPLVLGRQEERTPLLSPRGSISRRYIVCTSKLKKWKKVFFYFKLCCLYYVVTVTLGH